MPKDSRWISEESRRTIKDFEMTLDDFGMEDSGRGGSSKIFPREFHLNFSEIAEKVLWNYQRFFRSAYRTRRHFLENCKNVSGGFTLSETNLLLVRRPNPSLVLRNQVFLFLLVLLVLLVLLLVIFLFLLLLLLLLLLLRIIP